MGTPCPSVSRLRLTPLLPRSVGLGPVFFPAQRRFGHGPIHREPVPIDSAGLLKLLQSGLPQLEEDSGLPPTLESGHGPSNARTTWSDPGLATDSQCATHRKWHRHSRDRARVGVLPQSDAYSHALAAVAATPPTTHQKCESLSWCDYSGFVFVPGSWVLASSSLLFYHVFRVIRIGTKWCF